MIQINMDCEGPITQNDNAFELCEAFLPQGGDFFARISKYDDFLADVEKRPGYKAGDTLKLVLPFLWAAGVNTRVMREFSLKTLAVLPEADHMLISLASRFPTFIISTSYRPYLDALSIRTGFPATSIYCTELPDELPLLNEDEKLLLQELLKEIVSQPMLKWPNHAVSIHDLSDEDRRLVERLNHIFWNILPQVPLVAACYAINTVGGSEKAAALQDSLTRTGKDISQVLYAGDSITDVQALTLVRKNGGVAVSFNGNAYAVQNCEYACTGYTPIVIAAVAHVFAEKGRNEFNEMLADGPVCENNLLNLFERIGVATELISLMVPYCSSLSLERVTQENLQTVLARSEQVRKEVRGKQIAALG